MIYTTSFHTPAWRLKSSSEQLENMRRQMDNLFGALSGRSFEPTGAGVFQAINLTEDKDNYYLRAELPGVKNEAIELNVTDNTLTIAGERKIPKEDEKARYHRRERDAGKFSRAISMPGEFDSDKVQANLVNGILTVTVPKAEKTKPRQIAVN